MAGGASSLALDVGLALLLVLMAGAMAGLTIGLLGMSNLELEMKCEAGDARAIKIWPIKRDHHRLLVTLVVANAFASEALPLAIDRFTPSPLLSLLASVLLILFFGEILPSALFSGSRQLALAAFFIPLVRILMIILAPINIPLGMLLDRTMGKEGMHTRFQRNQLRNLVALHARATAAQRPSSSAPSPSSSSSLWAGRARAYKSIVEKPPPQLLGTDEAHIIQQTLKLHRETAQSIMTELAEVRMINFESLLDTETMARIIAMGHSRLPVYRGGDRRNVVGLLLVKNLIVVDPSEERPLSTIPLRAPLAIAPDYDLFSLLNLFQVGRGGHFAVITDQPDDLEHAWNHGTDVPDHVNVLGCVTLEDVIEELLGEAVFDETDFREHILINVLPSLREALNNHGSDISSHRGKERVYATVVRCALHWYHVTRSRRRRRLKAKSLSLKPTNSAREGADERDDDRGAADERTPLLKPEPPPPPAPVMASEQPDPSSYWHSDSEHSFLELSSLARHDYEFVHVLDPWVDVAELMAEDEGRWSPGGDAKPGGYLELTDQQLKEVKLDLNGRQLVVRQDTALLLEPGVTGSVVWDGGVALPLLVEEWRDAGVIGPLSDLCVWELGAGVGLTSCGLLALGAKHVVATDQSHMIPTLESNLRRNFPDCGCFTCGTLDWDDAETEIATLIRDGAPRCDMIVISDTWYNECIAKALVDALVAVAKTAPDGRKYTPCIALEEMRSADCLVGFLEEVLSRGITVVRVVKESIRYAGLSGHGRMIVFLFQL